MQETDDSILCENSEQLKEFTFEILDIFYCEGFKILS